MAHQVVLNLNMFSNTPICRQLAEELVAAIEAGRLRNGDKLPSIRELSKQLQISTITVREALDKLAERGLIESRHGSGNFVRTVCDTTAAIEQDEACFTTSTYSSTKVELAPQFPWSRNAKLLIQAGNDSKFHPFWDTRAQFEFRPYHAAEEAAPGSLFHTKVANWLRSYKQSENRPAACNPLGLQELRGRLAEYLRNTRQLQCEADDIILTSGAQHARDICARVLIEPGSRVVMEEPGSITDSLAYANRGAKIVRVRQDSDGISTSDLYGIEEPVKVAHLIPAANFPTGTTLSLLRREDVLDWAYERHAVIVEDSFGAGFHYSPAAFSLHALASRRPQPPQVVHIGSFSQLLNPAIRLGFIIAPPSLREQFTAVRAFSDLQTNIPAQEIVLSLFEDGLFEQEVLRLAHSARARRKVMLASLEEWPSAVARFHPVNAGFFQTIFFEDEELDDLRVFEEALACGVGVTPLSPYFAGPNAQHGLVLSFLQMHEEHIAEGMRRLQGAIETCRSNLKRAVPA